MYPGRIEKPNIENLLLKQVTGSCRLTSYQEHEHDLIGNDVKQSIILATQSVLDQNLFTQNISSYRDMPIFKNFLREKKISRVLNTTRRSGLFSQRVTPSDTMSNYIIVTNGQIASNLSDNKDFKHLYRVGEKLHNTEHSFLYELGTFNSIKIYVNAFLRWDNSVIYLIKNDFYWIDDYILGDKSYDFFTPIQKYSYNFYYQKDLSIFVDKYKII